MAENRAFQPSGAGAARSTTTGCGFMWKFSASRTVRAELVSGVRAARPAPMACTPASVRPATRAGNRMPRFSRAAAVSSTSCTESPLAWRCQPTNGAPSYSSRSAQRGHRQCIAARDRPSRHRDAAQEGLRAPWPARPADCTRRQPQRALSRRRPSAARPAPCPGGPQPAPAQPPAPSASRRAGW